MTKAQQTYERINALVSGGMQKAAAFKQLAEEYGQPVDSVRGAYYGHKRIVETGGQPGTGRSGVASLAQARDDHPGRHRFGGGHAGGGHRLDRRSSWKLPANGRNEAQAEHDAMRAAVGRPDRRDPGQDRGPRSGGRQGAAGSRRADHGSQGLIDARRRQMAWGLGVEQSLPRVLLLTLLLQRLHRWKSSAARK